MIFCDDRDERVLRFALSLCKERSEVEKVFGMFGISTFLERIRLLESIMGVTSTHYSSFTKYPEEKEQYDVQVCIFLEDEWKNAKNIGKAQELLEALNRIESRYEY